MTNAAKGMLAGPATTIVFSLLMLMKSAMGLMPALDPPGNIVMWRGLSRLTDITLGATIGAELLG